MTNTESGIGPQCDAGSVPAWTILDRATQHRFDLLLGEAVAIDVRLIRFGIHIVADVHASMLSP